MNSTKITLLFLFLSLAFNFFASEDATKESYTESARTWFEESKQDYPTFWRHFFGISATLCASGCLISSLKTGLYLLYTLKEVFSRRELIESNEEKEHRILDKFYKMVGSLFAAGTWFFLADFFDNQESLILTKIKSV